MTLKDVRLRLAPSPGRPSSSLATRIGVALLRAYQLALSPLFGLAGAQCRFHPSCSAYAIASLEKHGLLRGAFRAAGRLLRCHPLHPGGFDPP